MLNQARRKYEVEGMDNDLEDPRLVEIDDLMISPSLFPPIANTKSGITGKMIKSLLGNMNS